MPTSSAFLQERLISRRTPPPDCQLMSVLTFWVVKWLEGIDQMAAYLNFFAAFFRKTMDFSDINIMPDLTSMF
jgi:hypothetical protein